MPPRLAANWNGMEYLVGKEKITKGFSYFLSEQS